MGCDDAHDPLLYPPPSVYRPLPCVYYHICVRHAPPPERLRTVRIQCPGRLMYDMHDELMHGELLPAVSYCRRKVDCCGACTRAGPPRLLLTTVHNTHAL